MTRRPRLAHVRGELWSWRALEPQGPQGPQSPVFPFVWRQPRAGEGRQSLGERRVTELMSAALVSFRLACGHRCRSDASMLVLIRRLEKESLKTMELLQPLVL